MDDSARNLKIEELIDAIDQFVDAKDDSGHVAWLVFCREQLRQKFEEVLK